MKHSKIYTKKGDRGTTSTQNQKNIDKSSSIVEALGSCDELNSAIGLVVSSLPGQARVTKQRLEEIQRKIFSIGAIIAGNNSWEISEREPQNLELWIDEIDNQLEPLTGFILPSGSSTGALCHFARAVCRRCERNIVRLNNDTPIDPIIIQYLNRLSDFLFVLARYINRQLDAEEQKWHE